MLSLLAVNKQKWNDLIVKFEFGWFSIAIPFQGQKVKGQGHQTINSRHEMRNRLSDKRMVIPTLNLVVMLFQRNTGQHRCHTLNCHSRRR